MTTAARQPAEGTPGQRDGWLRRHGGHALVRAVRPGAEWVVLALTVRPGTATNTVSRIGLRLNAADGARAGVEIPVFDGYRRQWSLDLTAALPRETLAQHDGWSGEVVLDDEATTQVLPLLDAEPAAFALFSPPDLSGLTRPWVLAPASLDSGVA